MAAVISLITFFVPGFNRHYLVIGDALFHLSSSAISYKVSFSDTAVATLKYAVTGLSQATGRIKIFRDTLP